MTGVGEKLRGVAVVAAMVTAIALGVGGCSADPAAPADAATLDVVLRDFRISAPDRIAPGAFEVVVENRGPAAHEFALLRANGSRLPRRADGITVDEDAVEDRTLAALEPAEAGERRVDVELTPGRYVMICNMTGHWLGGMHRELVVR